MVEKAIRYENLNQQALNEQVALKLDQTYIRQQLETEHLVAFVANGSIYQEKWCVRRSNERCYSIHKS